MTSLRTHLETLETVDDLLHVEPRVHWTDVAAVGREAAEHGGPAVVFEDTPGTVRLASGVYGGPDRMQSRSRKPWSRIVYGIGKRDTAYSNCLDTVSEIGLERTSVTETELEATPIDTELYSLGLPTIGDTDCPAVTLCLLAYQTEDGTVWVPMQGTVRGGDELRGVVPESAAGRLAETPVTVVSGVPAASLITAHVHATSNRTLAEAPEIAAAVDPFPVASSAGGQVPAEAELVIDGTATPPDTEPTDDRAVWESAVETAAVHIDVTNVAAREDPIVPFTPVHASLSDDVQLSSIVESARLHARINSYWGVEPVEWVALPAETGLGMCLVASEILYAGFEWQLVNTLFSFSRLFDKVVVLDKGVRPADLSRAFDDMWVRAHPSHDWEFSDPSAPAATIPSYRQTGETGSRLYVNATWDPRWDETYIAPRVTFESSFPEDVRETVREQWSNLGFEKPFRGNR
ncbi:UbiD family decarboxylase domain-containing protein [Halococcus sp. AFM35]|uniref:UbiD family decarboxylase domain-containing protein n=1 Tax=Halococcus sp. AFM35 TaxID=3421653 RepID=UPI003EBE2438